MKPIDDPKFAEAARHYRDAVESSKRHSALAESSLQKYGDHGPQISGVIRDHFPQHIKEELRTLARDVTAHGNLADAARPRGVRNSTMRRLAQQVAGRYGSGFYGPQPGAYKKNPSDDPGEVLGKFANFNRSELARALALARQNSQDFALSADTRRRWKETAKLLRKELKQFAPKRRENPKSIGDKEAARELVLYIENANYVTPHGDSAATGRHVRDVLKNLQKKFRKGIYKPELAVKLWKYVADTAAKDYSRAYSVGGDGYGIFTAETRRMAAVEVEKGFREFIDQNEQINENPRSRNPSVKSPGTLWEYEDARGVTQQGTLENFSDKGGTDVTYFFRRSTGELDVVSGSRLKKAKVIKRNPMKRKKRRTAKQIAATKKLVAMNKKRRAGKSTKRARNPKAKFYRVFVACPASYGSGWSIKYVANIGGRFYELRNRRDSMELTKDQAMKVAKNPGFGNLKLPKGAKIGIASSSVTSLQIMNNVVRGKA